MTEDFSKHIFDIWFGTGKVLRIHLKDHGVVEGVLVGFYHGDEEHDTYISEWEMVQEDDYIKNTGLTDIPDNMKFRLRQEDILTIDFKYNK